jgi:predicted Zn-dependent protease
MKRIIFATILSGLCVMACQRVPITGRKQLMLVEDAAMNQMSFASYKAFLDTSKVVSSSPDADMVARVGSRLQKAVQSYLDKNKMGAVTKDFEWEYHLVQSKQVNAWCMPGGKVVVYSGILPITQNETGLAVVLSHEISHAIAKHGAERMSESMVQQGLLQVGQVAGLAAIQNPKSRAAFGNLYGIAAPVAMQVGVGLPHSRKQESEADRLGLIFMSMAGYDPKQAISFWERMSAGNQNNTPIYLSDHPSDQKRISDLKKELPEAMTYYKASPKYSGKQ